MFKKAVSISLISAVLAYSSPGLSTVNSGSALEELKGVQTQWAKIKYTGDYQQSAYKELQKLALQANRLSSNNPDSAEALTWDAIVLSSLAEKKGGIGALSLVNEALRKLERAEQIDSTVLGGSTYTSLATLYAKVPGWPIAFGSDSEAKHYFEKALAVNPNGLDVNFFYAEFLVENGEQQLALVHLDKALEAEPLEGRPIADRGRRAEVQKLRKQLLESHDVSSSSDK